MSQNTDYYQFTISSNQQRLSSEKNFSEFSTPPSTQNTSQNDLRTTSSRSSPIVSDVCMSSQNGVRNTSTTSKVKDNGIQLQEKYAFTLNFGSTVGKSRKDQKMNSDPFYTFDTSTSNTEDLHSPFELDVPLCEHHPMKNIQNEFLIDRMLKDDDNNQISSQYRSPNQSISSSTFNHPSPLSTPLSDHRDIDALSDAGTYIIDDDPDVARDDEPEPDIEQTSEPASSPFKRYATTKRNRHGTFDIHAIANQTTNQTVHRPIVDINTATNDLSSPSSSSPTHSSTSSSLLSLPTESDQSIRKEPEGASYHTVNHKSSNGHVYSRQRPNTLLEQKRSVTPPQNPIKPAECFVISPTFESKTFANPSMTGPRKKMEAPWRLKSANNNEYPSKKSSSPPPPVSARTNNNDSNKISFRSQETKSQNSNSSSSLVSSEQISKSSIRPHTMIQDQTYSSSSSPFQRNTSIRQTMPANAQYQRQSSAATTTTNRYLDEPDEMLSSHPSLTKVYMNKSFALRRQRSNVAPSTAKPAQQQQPQQPQPQQQQQQQQPQQPQQSVVKTLISRHPLKATNPVPPPTLTASSNNNSSSGQTNRAVELRRARAQAKIEELAQRTRQQLQKTEHHNDIMSTSWHSSASSNTSKRDPLRIRPNIRAMNSNQPSQKADLSKTRTISSSTHHRSSSASPNPLTDRTIPTRFRKSMASSVTDEQQYQRMSGSLYSEGDRSESLRDDGQRLAIKLIQLSSGILAKLKPINSAVDSDSNARILEQLLDQLHSVNQTLTTIDASLTTLTSDEHLL